MNFLLLFVFFVSVNLAKSILQKASNDRERFTTIIPLITNDVTFDEFEKIWILAANERQHETLCYFLPFKNEKLVTFLNFVMYC